MTPLTALALHKLANKAGIPEGVIQVVTPESKSTPAVGKEFCENPIVQKISFTGSTRVGKQLMKWSSSTVKRLSLELGGKSPNVFFESVMAEDRFRR